MREGEAGQELWCTGMICFSLRKSSLTASVSGGGGGRQDWGLPATWGTPHQASRTLGCYDDNLCFLQPLKQSTQESLREPNFVNKDSILYWKKPSNLYFSSVKKMYLSLFGVGWGIITFSKKEKWNKSTRGTTHPRQLVLFLVSTTSLCCVAQLSVFLRQTNTLQHLHLTLEKVRIQNTFLCQVFFFCKSCLFQRAPSSRRELVGCCRLLMACFAMQNCSQPGREWGEQGSAAPCNSACSCPTSFPAAPCLPGSGQHLQQQAGAMAEGGGGKEGLAFSSPVRIHPGLPASFCKHCVINKVLTGHQFVIWSSNRYMYPPQYPYWLKESLLQVKTNASELNGVAGEGGKGVPHRKTRSANTREAGVHSKSQYLYFSECRIQIFYNNL